MSVDAEQVDAYRPAEDLVVELVGDLLCIHPPRNRIMIRIRRDHEKGFVGEVHEIDRRDVETEVRPKQIRRTATSKELRPATPPWLNLRRNTWPATALNPVLGAAMANTSPNSDPTEYNSLSHYLSQTMLLHLLDGDRERRAWFDLFREYRTLFHSWHYASAVHIDLVRNQVSKSTKERALVHKGAAMSMLKRGLGKLQTANVDVLLIVMVILATHELDERTWETGWPMGFRPHEPMAYWMSAYGRLETIQEHLEAIARLVEYLGGLEKVHTPGLANCLAVTDLMVAGTKFCTPTFPAYWIPDTSILSQHRTLLSSTGHTAGRGFFTRIPCGLPPHALSVFITLATVDRYMASNSGAYATDESYRSAMSTRNAVHHSILSLPPWDCLDTKDRTATTEAVYECCRATAILYSTAVLYALPHHSNWHARPISYLRSLIETHADELRRAPDVLLWTLCICALATQESPTRGFFDRKLVEMGTTTTTTTTTWSRYSLAECNSVVEDFLWSRRACGDVGAVLWAAAEPD